MRVDPASCDLRAYRALTLIKPAHLLAAPATGHRAPLAPAASVEEEPAAAAPRTAPHATEALGVGQQLHGVGRHREADAARIGGGPGHAPGPAFGCETGRGGALCVRSRDQREVGREGAPAPRERREAA